MEGATMIALLGFEFFFDRNHRMVERLCVSVRGNETHAPSNIRFKLGEVSGEDEQLKDVLRKLFREFLTRFPEQPYRYSITMHVELQIMASMESLFRRQIVKQLKDEFYKKYKKHPVKEEIHIRFRGKVKANITCFHREDD
jgi:hypothetical protein